MNLKRLILIVSTTVLVCGAAALIFLFNSDLGRFKPQIEAMLSDRLDREFRVDELHLNLGWPVTISLQNLTIANAPWGSPEPLIRISRLDGEIDFWSLLNSDPVIIERVEIADASLNLAWNESGEGNFALGQANQGTASPKPERGRRAPVVLRNAQLTESLISMAYPDHTNRVEVQQLMVDEQPDTMMDILLEGSVNEDPMSFAGAIGPFQELLNAGAVSITGQGKFAELTLAGDIALDSVLQPHRPEVDIEIMGVNFSKFKRFLGLQPGLREPFSLVLTAREDGDDWIVSLDSEVGTFRLDMDATALGLRDLDQAELSLDANGPDLSQFLTLFGVQDAPAEPFDVSGVVVRDGKNLDVNDVGLTIGPSVLSFNGRMSDFPHLDDSTLELNITGPDIARFREMLDLPGAAQGAFSLEAELRPGEGATDIARLSFVSNLGGIEASGQITDQDDYSGSTFSVTARGEDAKAALEPLNLPGLEAGPFNISADLEIGPGFVSLSDSTIQGLYNLSASVDGLIAHEFLNGETDLNLVLSGDDLNRSLTHFDITLPLQPAPFVIKTGFRPDENELNLPAIAAELGTTQITAAAAVPWSTDLANLNVTLNLKGPNLTDLLQPLPGYTPPSEPWEVAARVRRAEDRILLEDVSLLIADMALTGSLNGAWPVAGNTWAFSLKGNGSDLNGVLPRIKQFKPAVAPFSVDIAGASEQGRIRLSTASIALGDASLEASGTIDDIPDFTATDFDLEVSVPTLAGLGTWADDRLPDYGFALTTGLRGDGSRLSLDDFIVRAGDATINGSVTLDYAGELPHLKLQLASEQIDLREWLPEPGVDESTASSPGGQDGLLIPDMQIPFDALKQLNGNFLVNIGRLETHRSIVTDLNLNAVLDQGILDINQYRGHGITGNINAHGKITALGGGEGLVSLNLNAQNLMPNHEDWQNADPATLPRFNAAMDLTATGSNVRELAAGLNGSAQATATEGRLPGKGLSALNALMLDQVLSLIVPGMSSQQPTTVLCFASRLDITDGLVQTDPMAVLKTDKLLLQSTGTVNLKDEKLKLGFATTPTKLLGANLSELVNPLLVLEGTLASPTPKIDPAGTLIYGGTAAATAGISILAKGLRDRFRSAANPCEQLRAELNGGNP